MTIQRPDDPERQGGEWPSSLAFAVIAIFVVAVGVIALKYA